MEITLEIRNDNELIKVLEEKDKLKVKYDKVRFIDDSIDYRDIMHLKNKLEIIDKLVLNYLALNEDIKEIICTRDTIIKPDHVEQCIPTNIEHFTDYDISFKGYLAKEGKLEMYYNNQADAIFAINKAKKSDMSNAMLQHFCKIGTNICFYPGIYQIQKGETIGIAKAKEKVKTLK